MKNCKSNNNVKIIEGLEETISYLRTRTSEVSERCIQYQREAIAMLKERGWTLITEDADGYLHGLPGDDGQYLMTDGKDIWIDDYVDGVDDGVWLDSGRDIREIKAWMDMPKLPMLNNEGRSVKQDDSD